MLVRRIRVTSRLAIAIVAAFHLKVICGCARNAARVSEIHRHVNQHPGCYKQPRPLHRCGIARSSNSRIQPDTAARIYAATVDLISAS